MKNLNPGIIWAVLAIVYGTTLAATDGNRTIAIIGGAAFAIVAVTSPWWRSFFEEDDTTPTI